MRPPFSAGCLAVFSLISKKPIVVLFLLFLSASSDNRLFSQAKDSAWEKIKPFFSPPAEYADKLGDYRSPLTFYNGEKALTPADWKKRRKEILNRWQDMMGHWPAIIRNPKVEIIETTRRENFTQYRIRFPWRKGEKTTAYLLVPDGKGKKPAVVTVYYEPESGIGLDKQHADFALQLARRGFVTLSIGTDYVSKAPSFAQYYPNADSATIQPLSMLAYLAANAYQVLANNKEVDPDRIGITGHSYGGKWAMFASCLYEKFACAAWSDGGIVFDDKRPNVNYWDPWYLGYFPPPWGKKEALFNPENPKGLYPVLRKEGYDLHELHALMAPRPFLVSGGSEDSPERWIPLNHAIQVNRLLGYENRVAMTNRPEHKPDDKAKEQLCDFFEYFLMTAAERKKRNSGAE